MSYNKAEKKRTEHGRTRVAEKREGGENKLG
jgi:hypothetical protein